LFYAVTTIVGHRQHRIHSNVMQLLYYSTVTICVIYVSEYFNIDQFAFNDRE